MATQDNILFKQGDDVELHVMSNIDLATATRIKVMLSVGGKPVNKYSTVNESGFGKATYDNISSTITVFVERNHSSQFPVGVVKAYILYNMDNSEFPDGNKTQSFEAIIGRVKVGMALDEDM